MQYELNEHFPEKSATELKMLSAKIPVYSIIVFNHSVYRITDSASDGLELLVNVQANLLPAR